MNTTVLNDHTNNITMALNYHTYKKIKDSYLPVLALTPKCMNEHHATNDNPAPAPSPASLRSQGGSQVLMATTQQPAMSPAMTTEPTK